MEAVRKIRVQNLHQITEVENFSFTVILHLRFNYCKGIIYIYECDIDEIDKFRDYLRKKYNVRTTASGLWKKIEYNENVRMERKS